MNSSLPQPWVNFERLMAIEHDRIEKFVEDKADHYPSLNPAALYTPLEDFYQIMTHPLIKGDWCDMGCGVGAGVLFYAWLFPERKSLGVEFSHSRAQAGQEAQQKLGLKNAQILEADLLLTSLPKANNYFLYFPTGKALDRILTELEGDQDSRIIAIESHGDLFSRLDEEDLEVIATIPLKIPRHHPEARIYQRARTHKKDSLLRLSFVRRYLTIQENDRQWIGESESMEWIGHKTFNLCYPPRTIKSQDVMNIENESEVHSKVADLCRLRRLGECEIGTRDGVYTAFIRKIFSEPSGFSLELSSGREVQWCEVQNIHWNGLPCYDSLSSSFSLPHVP
jgi:hypothetical protein